MKRSTLKARPPRLLFDDLEDDGTDRNWSRTPDDLIAALEHDPAEDYTEEERRDAVDPLLWIREEAQEKWAPFVSKEVRAFWQQRADEEAEARGTREAANAMRKPTATPKKRRR